MHKRTLALTLALVAGCGLSHIEALSGTPPADAAPPDVGTPDAGTLDAASLDADAPDAAPLDVGLPDASSAGGHWEPTLDAISCYGHTATLLPDGGVLLVGQCSLNGEAVAALRYDVSGRGGRAAILAEPRIFHGAVALEGGEVMIVAGVRAETDQPLRSTEIFDLATGTFRAGPLLGHPRGAPGVLRDGARVIVAGGSVGDFEGPMTSVELIDLRDGSVSELAPLTTPRSGTILAKRGDVILAIGGQTRRHENGTVEALGAGVIEVLPSWCWDPRASANSLDVICDGQLLELSSGVRVGPRLLFSHMRPAMARLADGSVLVLGSSPWTSDPPAFPERIFGDVSSPVPSPEHPYLWPTATLLPDGNVLVVGESISQVYVP